MSDGDVLALTSALTARERQLLSGNGGAMDPTAQLRALEDAVTALADAGVPCALIGGIAVGVRSGTPRATMDVDLAAPTTVARVDVVQVLTAAGFTLRGEHAHSLNFRHPTGEPLQVAFDELFDPVIDRAEPVPLGPAQVPVALVRDLIAMKERAAADPARRRSKALRDLADIELLREDVPDADEGW